MGRVPGRVQLRHHGRAHGAPGQAPQRQQVTQGDLDLDTEVDYVEILFIDVRERTLSGTFCPHLTTPSADSH